MQTAVQKLISEIKGYPSDCEIFQDAIEMEKQQIIDAYESRIGYNYNFELSGEQYYQEILKQIKK